MMLESISNYTTTLICTVMMMTIIKMLLPEGKNKKYILFVCGIITTIVMLNPITHFMQINVDEVLSKSEEEYYEYEANDTLYQSAINEFYETNLIEDITNRLKENGYLISNVRVEYDITYQPTKIYLQLEGNDGYVQPVKIEVLHQRKTNGEEASRKKIQEILSANYGIDKQSIIIEGGKQ